MRSTKYRIFILEEDSLLYRLYRDLFNDRERYIVMPQLTDYEKIFCVCLNRNDIVIADLSGGCTETDKYLAAFKEHFPFTQIIAVSEKKDKLSPFTEESTFSVLKRPFRFDLLRENVENCIRFNASSAADNISGGLDSFAYPLAEKVRRNPKGLRAELLNTIIELMQDETDSYTVREISEMAKVSVSTARRYMEYLLEDGKLTVEYSYKRAGHPEKRYTISLM